MDSFQPNPWHGLILFAVASVGIALSAIVAVHFSNSHIEAMRHQLVDEASTFADELEQYLQSREMVTKTVGSLFEAPDLSDPRPLSRIGKKVLTLAPEIGVIAWVPQVEPARIQEVFTTFSAAGRQPRLYGPNFETLDVTDIPRVLYPVMDVEPKSRDVEGGLGMMEVGLFPSRKAAFEQARDQQRVIATAPLALLQPPDTTGYILYSPVYDERGFAGCIMFTFRVDQLLNGFVRGRRIPMNYRVYDDTSPGLMKLMVEGTRQGEITTVDSLVRFDGAEAISQSVNFAGRKLSVMFDPGFDLFQAGLRLALMIVFSGLLLTAMILWGLSHFMRSSGRLAAEVTMTNVMRHDLELVNRELHHRVGNLLAVAQGIVGLSYKASLDAVEFRDSVIARLNALHHSVGLINRNEWKGVWLHELLQVELAPVMERINLSGQDALLRPRATQSLSLLFYELMANSTKHGALSKREGTVTAEWEIKDSPSGRLFCFRWRERDHGTVKPPARQGFGTKLLTRLVPRDLSGRGTVNFDSGYFIYELEAPIESVIEQESSAAVSVKAVVSEHGDAPEVPFADPRAASRQAASS